MVVLLSLGSSLSTAICEEGRTNYWIIIGMDYIILHCLKVPNIVITPNYMHCMTTCKMCIRTCLLPGLGSALGVTSLVAVIMTGVTTVLCCKLKSLPKLVGIRGGFRGGGGGGVLKPPLGCA